MDEQNPRVGVIDTEYSVPSATAERPEARTREIRAEIQQTREDMSETVNAIQERLRPSSVASDAAERVKHRAMEKVRDAADSESVMYVRANPIPTVMVGVGLAGLAWLAMARRDGRSANRWDSGSGPDASPTPRRTPRSGYAELTHDRQNHLLRTWNESPLLVGAASAVLGAMVGLAIPETGRENQLMGDARDTLMETVHETVRDKVSRVQQVTTDAAKAVQDGAMSAVGLTSLEDSDKREGEST